MTILLVEQRALHTVALADRTHVLVAGELGLTLNPADAKNPDKIVAAYLASMILAAVNFQTLSDAVGLGAIYALMAVGIGLVFGVLRLVNFAYGQLVMAGAYTLAFTSAWPVPLSIAACFGVVVALSLAMETVVFRPLRGQSPAVMLVTTFAIAFLLQAIALIIDLRDDTLGEVAASITSLNEPISVGGVDIRKITLVSVAVAAFALLALALLLTRTTIGLHTRAAATDFRTARLLGVRANRVIAVLVVLSGLLAAAVAVMMTVQFPLVVAGLRLAGHDRRARRRRRRRDRPALDGDPGRLHDRVRLGRAQRSAPDRQDRLPALGRVRAGDPRPAAPAGRPFRLGAAGRRRTRMRRRADAVVELLGPSALVIAVGLVATTASLANQVYFMNALVSVAIVVAIYVFVGNSGVLSFGQISFVAVGAFAAGVMTVPLESKKGVLTTLFPFLRDHTIGNVPSLLLAAGLGGVFAFLVGPAADAPLRTCRRNRDLRRARDHAQHPARVDEDRPGRDDPLARARDRRGRCKPRSARSS